MPHSDPRCFSVHKNKSHFLVVVHFQLFLLLPVHLMMDGWSNSCSSTTSNGSNMVVPTMSPKSPPGGFDLYGKRRQLLKLQILEKEIGLLEEELKSIDGLQAASRCCKEIDEFIGTKPEPLVSKKEESYKSEQWWKRICFPWNFCMNGCQPGQQMPTCFPTSNSHLHSCCKYVRLSCMHLGSSCLNSSLSVSNCKKVNLCCDCSKTCHGPSCP